MRTQLTPVNARIVIANPNVFAPLTRWLHRKAGKRYSSLCQAGACFTCLEEACVTLHLNPNLVVQLCTTPDLARL